MTKNILMVSRGVFVVLCLLCGWFVSEYIVEPFLEPEPTCADLQEEIWAFQQCLNFKPSCQIAGPESFARYHRIKDLEQESCPESADDFQSGIN
jgi:hypothetical protein